MPKKIGLLVATILIVNLVPLAGVFDKNLASAADCLDLKVIFARGSGEKRWVDQNFLTFKSELESKLKLVNLKYDFLDLDYPAIDVGNFWTLLTTFVGRGDAYEFGASIDLGVKEILNEVNNSTCPNTKFVLGGYSQGAMVISKAAPYLKSERIVYAATFGDPKIYLPEGFGAMPDACRGANLSNYRVYVPDCRVYEGLLGSYRPYQPDGLIGKMGTWCNHTDLFCSTYLSIKSHTSYVSDGLYADASKLIFDKITRDFGVENKYISLHDTAILIDSTISMSGLISQYKAEALNLARQTLENGGRVALYDYRDVADGYEPKEWCDFETCTLETFQAGIDAISTSGGGDIPESLLSAGLKVMRKLNWNYGSTKSVVVLTDSSYHNPDLDGTTFDDVVTLSKKIDPVNFYFVVPNDIMSTYKDFAEITGGVIASSTSNLSLLTNTIISRYDSLPRVEEDNSSEELPKILNSAIEILDNRSAKINWNSNSSKVIVALNDYILGVAEGDSIVLEDLDFTKKNVVTLIPINDARRGRGIDIEIEISGQGNMKVATPKAPNAGRR